MPVVVVVAVAATSVAAAVVVADTFVIPPQLTGNIHQLLSHSRSRRFVMSPADDNSKSVGNAKNYNK